MADWSHAEQLGIPDDAHWALVTLTSPAAPDDLVAAASSYDASGRYGLQSRFSASLGRHFAGGEWRSDAAHNALATVTNGGSKATAARLTLHYDDGRQKYEMQQTIQPGGQMWVNFADLIHSRTPDRQGNLLPADLASATYEVQDLSPGPGSLAAATLAVNNSSGSQVSPDYPNCCGAVYPGWSPVAFDLFPGVIDDAAIDASNSCTGGILDISGDFTSWFSANPAVAQVTTRKVQAVSPGFTTGSAKGAVLEGGGAVCVLRVVQVNAPIRVQVPTSLKVVKTTILQTGNSGDHGCSLGYYGIELDVVYQVLDQNTPATPIQSSAMTPQEYIVWYDGTNNGGFKNIGPTYISTTSETTRADGTFDDAPIGICSPTPFNTPLTSTQTIQIMLNGQAYLVRTNKWQFSSTNLTNHGTVTNGSDIKATQ